jgi:hypothetical protein
LARVPPSLASVTLNELNYALIGKESQLITRHVFENLLKKEQSEIQSFSIMEGKKTASDEMPGGFSHCQRH